MLKDTLYAKHIEERSGGKILEDSAGFIAYRVSAQELFIIDMHIAKEFRKSGEGRKLISRLIELASESGCNVITGNVQLADPGSSNTLIAALTVGFRVVNGNSSTLLIAKELG